MLKNCLRGRGGGKGGDVRIGESAMAVGKIDAPVH